MKKLTFAAAFAADLSVERIPFNIDGNEAFVDLRKMDFGARAHYDTLGVKINQQQEITSLDGEARARYLVSRTVQNFQLWKRANGADSAWQMVVPPEGNVKQRQIWLEANLDLDGEFGKWLHEACLTKNGMDAETAKNSTEPSSD